MVSLSVIITTYNHEKYIKKCIESVLNQKEINDFEIIIGNDCSTDKTAEIIEEYANNYKQIKVLPRKENLGMQKNLQDCFANCKGDYIAICEGDDYWIDSLKAKKMINAFERYPNALLCFTNTLLQKGNDFIEHAKNFKNNLNEIVTINDVIFPRNLIANFSCCMYRREILKMIPNNYWESGNADWLFNMYALDHCYGIYIDDVCSVYRLHDNSIYSSINSYNKLLNKIDICWKYNKLFAYKYNNEFYEHIKKCVIDYFNELKKINSDLVEENKQLQNKYTNLSEINMSLQHVNETVNEIIKINKNTNDRAACIIRINKNTNDRAACIIRELRELSSRDIFSRIYKVKKKFKNNKIITSYYLFGLRIFKKKQHIVNYNNNIGLISCKYVHILHKTIITSNIVKLLNNYFNATDHVFIFNSGGDEKILEKLHAKNIFYGNINTLKLDIKKLKKVIVHGLFSPRLSEFLYNNPNILAKTYWAIFGGDLYSYPDNDIENYVRKNIAGIITTFDTDEYYNRFGYKPAYDIVYNNPIAKYIKKPIKHKKNKPYKIMINNSTDETTLEMLDVLSKFKDENILITTNLSYFTYGQSNIKEEIIKKGNEIFGNKFKPILKWKSPKQYVRFLSSVDVYIANQNRQQGVGNISALMLLGKKVYIKSNISSYIKFKKLGIKVFDVSKIKKSSLESFLNMNENDVNNNIAVLKNRLSLKYQIDLWSKLFND